MGDDGGRRMRASYRHTQVGWIIIIVMAVVAIVPTAILIQAQAALPLALMLGISGVVLALFGTLTVCVDTESIEIRFGIGLFRRRVSRADIKSCRCVRNPWYYGWGVRFVSGGMLYNVSGLSAVELALANGKRLRVGTDEPEKLANALRELLAVPPASAGELPGAGARLGGALALGVALGVIMTVGILFYVQMQPPEVAVTEKAVRVASLFYGERVALGDIADASLEPRLPRVLLRTNGFALGGILRGHFNVEGLGDGQLFVDAKHSPFVVIRKRRGFLIVNLSRPEETRRMFAVLEGLLAQRAKAAPSLTGATPGR
jgi:hypothetical protein